MTGSLFLPNLPLLSRLVVEFRVAIAIACFISCGYKLSHSEHSRSSKNISTVSTVVGVEPRLLPLSGEALPSLRSANTDDQARLDIEAYGFWVSHHEPALCDVFNPFARSYVTSPIGTTYRRHERAKVREYKQRVREIERASFTPLVFSATGGMAPRAKS